MKAILLTLALLSGLSHAAEVRYWACNPQGKPNDPSILIIKQGGKNALFWTNRDLEREEGTLVSGQYMGTLEPSASGFTLFAKLDVAAAFPNTYPNGTTSSLMLPLNLKASVFLAEMYLLWGQKNGETQGLIVGYYGCRAK